jgi:hypothetical protein
MLSRALSLATVTLLIGGCAAVPAWGQATNLEAGKSPSQIFAGTCTACHKSPRGLLRSVPAGSLQSFLRQHYTTSPDMATSLTGFLVSNGVADTRGQPKDGKTEARTAPSEQLDRFGHRLHPATQEAAKPEAEPREAARPDADGLHGRNAKHLARPGEAPAAEGRTPAEAAGEIGPDGSKLSARQRLGRRGKPGEEQPKTESAKTDTGGEEPAKGEAAREEQPKSESAKVETGKPEGVKPPGEGKSESAKIEAPKETGSAEPQTLRADPVPPVTPAPTASPTVSAAVPSGTPEPAAAQPASPAAPQTVTAAAPPPVEPAGPPAPPISQ